MLQNSGCDSECSLSAEDGIEEPVTIYDLQCKPVLKPQTRGLNREIGSDFRYDKNKVDCKTIDKIPTIANKLVIDMGP
jgi:hypothetical protein